MIKQQCMLNSSKVCYLRFYITDSTGFFEFKNIQLDNYNLRSIMPVIRLFPKIMQSAGFFQYRHDRSNFLHAPDTRILQSIVVSGKKSIIENKIDRIVYNVDKDITSQGGVATDVLRKIPQVTVDINGNVELLGQPKCRFLINGKHSTIFGNSIADALQSIPASQIQSIEVMSSPGAKYDAAGTGGIINIILKKNKSQGFSGVVNAQPEQDLKMDH